MSMLTGGPISAIPAVGDAQRAIVVDDREDESKARNGGVQGDAFAELPTPTQPLPLVAEGMTPEDLFRMMREVCQKIVEATAGTSDAAIESKKELIGVQAEKKVEALRERQAEIEEKLETQKDWEIVGWVAVGVVAVIAGLTTFITGGLASPLTALAVGGLVAIVGSLAMCAGDIVEAFAPGSASDDAKKNWTIALTVALTLVSFFIPPFNPVAAMKAAAGVVRTGVQVGVQAVQTAIKFLATAGLKTVAATGAKLMASILARLASSFKNLMTSAVKAGTKAAARLVNMAKSMANTLKGLAKAAQQAMRNLAKFINEMKAMITKLAQMIKAGRASDVLDILKALGRNVSNKFKALGDGFKQSFNQFQQNLKNLSRTDEIGDMARQGFFRSAQRFSMVTQGGLGMAQAYGEIDMAQIDQEMIEGKAKHQKLEASFQQCLEMLNKELPRLTKVIESCASFKEAERDFARSQTNLARA